MVPGVKTRLRSTINKNVLVNDIAAAGIVKHSLPSGVAEPSQEDHLITSLRAPQAPRDNRVLDHIGVAGGQSLALA